MFSRQTQVKLPERCDGLAPRQPTWHSTPRCAADARATVQPHASAGAVAMPRACHFDAGKLKQSSLHRQLGTRARGHLARGATDARATAHPQPSARSHRRKIRSTLVVPLVGRDVVPQVVLQSSPPLQGHADSGGWGRGRRGRHELDRLVDRDSTWHRQRVPPCHREHLLEAASCWRGARAQASVAPHEGGANDRETTKPAVPIICNESS